MRDHRDLVTEGLQQRPDPFVVEAELLEQRVQFHPDHVVAAQAVEVLLDAQFGGVHGAERDHPRGVEGTDELVGAVDVPGVVGDAHHDGLVDPAALEAGLEAADRAVEAGFHERDPAGEGLGGDLVGPDVTVRVENDAAHSFPASPPSMT